MEADICVFNVQIPLTYLKKTFLFFKNDFCKLFFFYFTFCNLIMKCLNI